MTLTVPLLPSDLRTAYPRDTRGMEDTELTVLLRLEERALRNQFGVTDTREDTGAVLADAMLLAWPSFWQQVQQVAQEQTGATSYTVTYNRAGATDFAFPAFVGAMLSGVADPAAVPAAPAVTQLVRGVSL